LFEKDIDPPCVHVHVHMYTVCVFIWWNTCTYCRLSLVQKEICFLF